MALWLVLLAVLPVSGQQQHHWPQTRGDIGRYSFTPIVGPGNLSASLAWRWRHPTLAVLTGMALIDADTNIYLGAMDGVHKFTRDGELVWHYSSVTGVGAHRFGGFYAHAAGSLDSDSLYASGTSCIVFKLDLVTGRERWKVQVAQGVQMDTPYVHHFMGLVLVAHSVGPDKANQMTGNRKFTALNASTGTELWTYTSDYVHWNFHPMFPGDDTFLTMDIHGGMHRMKLLTGELVWYAPPQGQLIFSFTDGGFILDQDGDIYTCSDLERSEPGTGGALRKLRGDDGSLIWQRELPAPCVSWPASDGRSVVVPVGMLPVSLPPAFTFAPDWLPQTVKWLIHWSSLWLGPQQGNLFGTPPKPLMVQAFNPKDGRLLWSYESIPAWPYVASRGDEELFTERLKWWPYRPVCGPASWSAPTIGGDGTVYAAAMNGVLYAIRDANGDGQIQEATEVSQLEVGDASLHGGSAFAPGLMAFATCAELFVFRW